MRRRVKITGLGFITPAGIGKEAFKEGILQSISRVEAIKRFDPAAGAFVASEVKKFKIEDTVSDPAARRVPRQTQFALAATVLALRDAGLTAEQARAFNPVVSLGTSLLDFELLNKTIGAVTLKGPRHTVSRTVFQAPVSSIGGAVVELIGCGRALTVQSACCSSTDAIGQAYGMVISGQADLAICGGTEAPIHYPSPMLELKRAGLAPDTSERAEELGRPFDLWRTTGVIGEGACVMILECDSSPRKGYAEIAGYAYASDPGGQSCMGLYDAIRCCLANASLRTSEIEHISAWGPGHRVIDAAESTVLRKIFGADLDRIPVASIKGAIGNPLGAAGAIQAGCAALGIREGFIPPTVNWKHPDPACRLNLSDQPRFISFANALVNAHGVGGANACLLLRQCT